MRQSLVIEYEQESRFIGFQPLQDEASECSAQTGQVIKFPGQRRVRPVGPFQRVAIVCPCSDEDGGWRFCEFSDGSGAFETGLTKKVALEKALEYVRECNSGLIVENTDHFAELGQ